MTPKELALDNIINLFQRLPDEVVARPDGQGDCIASTGVFIRVLKRLGYDAEPLCVSVAVYNSQHSVGCGDWPEGREGAYKPSDGGFAGHLVIWLPKERILIDPVLHVMMRRPEKGMDFPMPWFRMPDGWDGSPVSDEAYGCTFVYKRLDGVEKYWRFSHAWQGMRAEKKRLANLIIEQMKESV